MNFKPSILRRVLSHRETQDNTLARTSNRVLTAVVALTVVVFAAFYSVGYDNEAPGSGGFNAPLLTDLLLWFVAAVTLAAAAVTVYSVCGTARRSRTDAAKAHGFRPLRITAGVAAGLVIVLAACFAAAPTDTILVNGVAYTDTLGLRLTAMLVDTSLILLAAAALAVVAAVAGAYRFTRHKTPRP